MVSAINNTANINQFTFSISNGVTDAFSQGICDTVDMLNQYSDVTRGALSDLDNIIILESKDSDISDEFSATEDKFHKYALPLSGIRLHQ